MSFDVNVCLVDKDFIGNLEFEVVEQVLLELLKSPHMAVVLNPAINVSRYFGDGVLSVSWIRCNIICKFAAETVKVSLCTDRAKNCYEILKDEFA